VQVSRPIFDYSQVTRAVLLRGGLDTWREYAPLLDHRDRFEGIIMTNNAIIAFLKKRILSVPQNDTRDFRIQS
jgi:hypothetical protein